MKKTWNKPELVVLFRGKPEESVLFHCKHKNNPVVAPASFHEDCNHMSSAKCTCGACQDNANRS
ncbi:MAG: hypothetical protein ACYDH0_05755 [Candidatus Aminicenantales bacterium]